MGSLFAIEITSFLTASGKGMTSVFVDLLFHNSQIFEVLGNESIIIRLPTEEHFELFRIISPPVHTRCWNR